jgi:hypothetical protein
MTVGELKALLAALPEDMAITILDKEHQVPYDITMVSRGRWAGDYKDFSDDEFVQDDENGDIAVIVPW